MLSSSTVYLSIVCIGRSDTPGQLLKGEVSGSALALQSLGIPKFEVSGMSGCVQPCDEMPCMQADSFDNHLIR